MWLLLVAAGTGYLARCWCRARRFKSDPCFVQHSAGLSLSQRSPSCTPRRGRRPASSSHRSFRGRSQSSKGASRKSCRRRREGRSTRPSNVDDEVVDSVDKLFGGGVPVRDTISGQRLYGVQNPEMAREGMEGHVRVLPTYLLPPVFTVGFLNNTLETKILASETSDLTHRAWLPSPCKKESVHSLSFPPPPPPAVGAAPYKLPQIVTKEKDGQQGFSFTLREPVGRISQLFTKIARNFGQKASTLSCKKLEKGIRLVELHREKCYSGPHALSSNLLKALLDPEYYTQTHRTKISSSSMKGHADLFDYLCPSHQAAQISASNVPDMGLSWEPSGREMHGPCACTGAFSIALGMAMGMVTVVGSHKSEVAELQKLVQDTNSMIHQLKQQMDSNLQQDCHGAPGNEEPLTKNGVDDEACLLKPHPEPYTNSCGGSVADSSSLELFRADNGGALSILPANHMHGLSELEAELEAELQLMEQNVGNNDICGWETKHINYNETNGVHQVDGELYLDRKDFESDTFDLVPVQVMDQFCESDYAVPPLELERRLWQVLEQRQEERISELENDLHLTQETVAAQTEEIQWWKDRVWWLMETSIGGKLDSV